MHATRLVLAFAALVSCSWICCGSVVDAQEFETRIDVEAQPLKAQARRIAQALEFLGEPLTRDEQARLDEALAQSDDRRAVAAIQQLLDARAIAEVNVNPESRVKVAQGPAEPLLHQHGWRVFLVKVHNQAGVRSALRAASPNAAPIYVPSTGSPAPNQAIGPAHLQERWMDIQTFDDQPLVAELSGLELEYRIVQIYSRDAGKREATLTFDVGQGTQDLGFRSDLAVLFESKPAVPVSFGIRDDTGLPTTAHFTIRDAQGRVYPARSRRLEPDFFFHDQIYRSDGESVLLPPGEYQVSYSRGPEYRTLSRKMIVPDAPRHKEEFQLQRWIKLADHGWYSGDHHVHAAGCAHYESPTEGVTPEAMMRHIVGEDLNVGCVLSWGPCWYHQKTFFDGQTSALSQPGYLMRYDVEVSGFPSSHCGHLCLLNLQEDDYAYAEPTQFDYRFGGESGHFSGTQTDKIAQWPSWDLPVLQWAQRQGAVVGFSHSGAGLAVPGTELPNYAMPRFDGIGANEYIVDVVHGACDFISTVDTPAIWELSIWYHTLNCGYTCRISGETDFPCIYGERVGLGRVYVNLGLDELNFETWVEGIKSGRSYVSDGLSHLFNYQINGLGVGQPGSAGADAQPRDSFLSVQRGTPLQIKVDVAARLDEQPDETLRRRPLDQKPYWHLERARIGPSRRVPVELIVNGQPVERREIEADGTARQLEFSYVPERSSWIAVRIFPSSHTNPIFVELEGQPIRASRRSAQWCLQAVEVCWESKRPQITPREQAAARAAYDLARDAYQQISDQSYDDRQP